MSPEIHTLTATTTSTRTTGVKHHLLYPVANISSQHRRVVRCKDPPPNNDG